MTIELASELISRASVTPDDCGCQQLIAERLEMAGFTTKHLRFDDVDNVWLTHGEGDPIFTFLGHTDVVPPGPVTDWQSDPFTPVIKDGYLFGRGAADMKGSIAAMVTAMERFVSAQPKHPGILSLLLTSDEEGVAINGIRKVVDYLQQNKINIKWCLVGEPSSRKKVGDVVKNGRRGSLCAEMTIYGTQGHVAYPDMASNPIDLVIPAMMELTNISWDQGNDYYPPTSFQISNINAGTGAENVIPGKLDMMFNFRYSTEVDEDELIQRVQEILNKYQLRFKIQWRSSGLPFLTDGGRLLDSVKSAIKETTNNEIELSTAGGTSDGRFIAPTGAEVIELGPVNATIHKIDECVYIDDLNVLSSIYEKIISDLLS